MWETQLREPSAGNERIIARNRVLTDSKPKAPKTLICSTSKEGTDESSGSNKIQQRFHWHSASLYYKCAKQELIVSRYEKQNLGM